MRSTVGEPVRRVRKLAQALGHRAQAHVMNANPITPEEIHAAVTLSAAGWRFRDIARVLKRDHEALGRKARAALAEERELRRLREIRA